MTMGIATPALHVLWTSGSLGSKSGLQNRNCNAHRISCIVTPGMLMTQNVTSRELEEEGGEGGEGEGAGEGGERG